MKTQIVIMGIVTGTLLVVGGAWLFFAGGSPLNRGSALATTREWARLEAFPEGAKGIHIELTGSMFTRGVVVQFEAPEEENREWLRKSPGTQEATPERMADGSTCYHIKPGGGAQFAEVTVSADGRKVRIHTYWS